MAHGESARERLEPARNLDLREYIRGISRISSQVGRPWVPHALGLLALALLLARTVYAPPYVNSPPIRSDGEGYHAWTRAILNWDFRFCEWRGEGFISHIDEARGVCQNKYPPGLALLRLPVMAFLAERQPASPRTFTPAEHTASLMLGALALWLTAALLAWTTRLLRLPSLRSVAVVAFTVFGTGLFHYGTYDSAFTHVYSALFCALLIALTVREHVRWQLVPRSALLLSGFFLLSLRLTNIISVGFFCLAYLALTRRSWRAGLGRLAYLGAGCALAVLLQLVYNHYALGTLRTSSYGDERFIFERPMQGAVLLSYERGLITYTPLYALAAVAGLCHRRSRTLACLFCALCGAYIGLYGYWHSWMLGGGMGHRGFVELAPLLAVVLCIALGRASWPVAGPVLGTAAACAFVTLQLMSGYWLGTYPMGGATADDYWKHLQVGPSLATGGTLCRPSTCDWVDGAGCQKESAPALTRCWTGSWKVGACTGSGTCAPVVALSTVGPENGGMFVSAPPPDPHIKKHRPLVARVKTIGPWERYMVLPAGSNTRNICLRSLTSGLYVSAAVGGNDHGLLAASAKVPGPRESFTRVELQDGQLALRASDSLYVSAPSDRGVPQPLRASSQTVGAAERFVLVGATP